MEVCSKCGVYTCTEAGRGKTLSHPGRPDQNHAWGISECSVVKGKNTVESVVKLCIGNGHPDLAAQVESQRR